MAVGTTPVEVADRVKQGWSCRVPAGDVTGIAHPRHAQLQQLGVAGPVRFMAVGAVLHYRWVFPQEGAAPFGVACQAVFVDRALPELAGIGRAVRIMATATGHLPFPVRHVRGALQLRPPHLVTAQAEFGLSLL